MKKYLLILFLLLQVHAVKSQIKLVKDIADNPVGYGDVGHSTVVGNTMFLVASDTHGTELWKSDGTDEGTMLLKEIQPFGNFSFPDNLIAVDHWLFFTAWDGGAHHGRALWKSDGTPAGTVFIKDFLVGDNNDGASELTELNGILYFKGGDATGGKNLWRSDGSPAGTYMVKQINVGWEGINGLVKANGKLFFEGYSSEHGHELWVSDGTASGTHEVMDIFPGNAAGLNTAYNSLKPCDGGVYFIASDGIHGAEIWKSDGTAEGTSMVVDFVPGNNEYGISLSSSACAGNKIFFRYGADDIWVTTITSGAEGTAVALKIPDNLEQFSNPDNLRRYDDKLLFTARSNDGSGDNLWISDGTPEGTVKVKNINPNAQAGFTNFTECNDKIYFSANDGTSGFEPWVSDGTTAGTFKMLDVAEGDTSSYPGNFVFYNGQIFFSASRKGFESALFREDGTMVKKFQGQTASFFPRPAFSFQNEIFFFGYGTSLWKSDGTENGTQMVRSSLVYEFDSFVEVGGRGFFISGDNYFDQNIYTTDGTEDGTHLFFDLGHDYTPPAAHQNFLYFCNGYDLYKSDGSAEGTALLKTLPFEPALLFSCGDYLYMASGGSLWRSDGTAEGTVMLKGNLNIVFSSMTSSNGNLFFFSKNTDGYIQLWRSDGTESGTTIIKTLPNAFPLQISQALVDVNGILFFSANTDTQGPMLWKSDGTTSGTLPIKDLHPTDQYFMPWFFKNVNGTLYFTGVGSANDELWKSDGTSEGTVLVKKWEGYNSFTSLMAMNHDLFFVVSSSGNGYGIGKSDGTPEGTLIYYPNDSGAAIGPLMASDNKVFFSFESFKYGTELYELDTSPNSFCQDFSVHSITGNNNICTGSSINLTAHVETSNQSLTYTWLKDEHVLSGENTSSLNINSSALTDAGVYEVQVSNGNCVASGNKIDIQVHDKPAVIVPEAAEVCSDDYVKVILQSDRNHFIYGYEILNANIPAGVDEFETNVGGAVDSVGADYLYYNRFQNNTSGTMLVQYEVRPVNMDGCVGDAVTVNLKILPYPFLSQPSSQAICEGSAMNLEVSARGTGLYQWKKNDVDIPGATNAGLTILNVTSEDGGDYSVVYVNQCETISGNATVEILKKPMITNGPSSVTITEGDTLTLKTNATGSDNTYQWKKNGLTLVSPSSPNYTKSNASLTDAGSYSVTASNNCGSIISGAALVTVLPRPQFNVTSNLQIFATHPQIISSAQKYSVSGAHLQNEITIVADANFEISNEENGIFNDTLLLSPNEDGSLPETNVFVRFSSSIEGTYQALIHHQSASSVLFDLPVKGISRIIEAVTSEQDDIIFTIYPNPITDELKIDLKDPSFIGAEIAVYSANGQTKYISTRSRASNVIVTRDWLPGNYVVTIRNGPHEVLSREIVKIK